MVGSALWRPADVGHFVVALPGSGGASFGRCRGLRAWDLSRREDGNGVILIDQVPDQNEAVITSGGEDATSARRPFDAIQRGRMTLQFEESLAWLPHIENANNVGFR